MPMPIESMNQDHFKPIEDKSVPCTLAGTKRSSPSIDLHHLHQAKDADSLETPSKKKRGDGNAMKSPLQLDASDESTATQPPSGRVRRGKWTNEEQAYADRLIRDFEAGLLPLENGTTLRAYLSKKLNCDPMRISKKFAGNKCLGKVR